MATDKYKYIERFVSNYGDTIERLLGRKINIDDFDSYRKDIAELTEVLSAASVSTGDNSIKKIKEFVDSKNAKSDKALKKNPNSKLSVKSVDKLFEEYYNGLNDLEKEKSSIKNDGFEKDLAKQNFQVFRIFNISNYYMAKNLDGVDAKELQNMVYSSEFEGKSFKETQEAVNSYIDSKVASKEAEKQSVDPVIEGSSDEEVISQDSGEVIESFETKLKRFEDKVQDLTSKTEELEELTEKLKNATPETIDSLKARYDSLGEEISNLKQEIEALSKDVADQSLDNEGESPIADYDEDPIVDGGNEPVVDDGNEPEIDEDKAEETEKVIQDGGQINGTNEWVESYAVITDRINSIERNVNDVINEYSAKCSKKLTLDDSNIQKNANVVLMHLPKEERKEFVNRINSELSETNKIKREIADQYIKITEEGIKKLREIKNGLEEAEKDKEKIDEQIEKKEIERKEKEDKLKSLEEKLNVDPEKVDQDILDEVTKLREEISDIDSELKDLNDKSKKSLEDITRMKDEFESSKTEYLEAAEGVKGILEQKGITIGLKNKQIDNPAEKDNAQTTNAQTTNAPAATQPATQTVTQTVAPVQQVVSGVNPAPQNYPSTNINLKEKLNTDYNNLISSLGQVNVMLSPEEYGKVLSNLNGIIKSEYNLSKSQRNEIKKIFNLNKEELLGNMSARSFTDGKDLIELVSRVTGYAPGSKELEIIRAQFSDEDRFGNKNTGEFLTQNKVDEQLQNLLKSVMGSYSSKVKNGELSEDDIKLFEDAIGKPMRFAYLDQCAQIAGKYGNKKFLGMFPMARKKVDSYLVEINQRIKDVDEYIQNEKVASQTTNEQVEAEEPVYEQTKEEREQMTEEPKTFRQMLGNLINSQDEIDLSSGVTIETTSERIKWNRKFMDDNGPDKNGKKGGPGQQR